MAAMLLFADGILGIAHVAFWEAFSGSTFNYKIPVKEKRSLNTHYTMHVKAISPKTIHTQRDTNHTLQN